MRDRLTNGFFAGIVGGVVMTLINFISHYGLNFAEKRYLDFAAIFIFGHEPTNLTQVIFAQIGHLFFTGLLGIIFAYLIPVVTSKNIFFKGWLYGVAMWFAIYAITVLFEVPVVKEISQTTAISNAIGASLYGITIAVVLYRINGRIEI